MSSVDFDAVAGYCVKSEPGKKTSIWLKSEVKQDDLGSQVEALGEEKPRPKVHGSQKGRNNKIYRRLYQMNRSWCFWMLPSSSLHLPLINARANPLLAKAD